MATTSGISSLLPPPWNIFLPLGVGSVLTVITAVGKASEAPPE